MPQINVPQGVQSLAQPCPLSARATLSTATPAAIILPRLISTYAGPQIIVPQGVKLLARLRNFMATTSSATPLF